MVAVANAKAITGLAVYTDGSGTNKKIGAAAVLMLNDMELKTLQYRLGTETEHTVYEAEITAVILALHLLMQVERNLPRVTIRVDNQAVLLGLKNQRTKPGHHLLNRVHNALEDFQVKQAQNRGRTVKGYRMGQGRTTLSDSSKGWKEWKLKRWCKVKFVWVLGHEDIDGNEKANEEAKQAVKTGSSPHRQLPTFLRRKELPISISATRQELKGDIKKRWNTEWKVSPHHMSSVNIDYSLSSDNYIHIIIQLRQNQASILTQLQTGHLPLNNILFRIKQTESPGCPHCNNGTRETTLHFLFFCPHYETVRHIILAATQ